MAKNNVIKKAKEEYDYLTGNARLQRLAELREKALKDRNSLYNYGHRTGTEEGMKKGYKKGHGQGVMEEKNRIVKALAKQNCDINFIIEVTGLTKEEIEEVLND